MISFIICGIIFVWILFVAARHTYQIFVLSTCWEEHGVFGGSCEEDDKHIKHMIFNHFMHCDSITHAANEVVKFVDGKTNDKI